MSGTQPETVSTTHAKGPSVMQTLGHLMKANIKQYTMFIALVMISLIFSVLTGGIFLTARNLSNLLLQTATIAILACGMLLIIIAADIDLSVGSVAGFTGAIAAVLQVKLGWDTIPVIIATLVVGVIVGVWQGYWVAYKHVPAFIVTLAGQLIFRGGVIYVTKGQTIAPMQDSFKIIGQGYIPNIASGMGDFNLTTAIIGVVLVIGYIIMEVRKRRERIIKYNFSVLPLPLEIAKITCVSVLVTALFGVMASYRGIPYCIILLLILIAIFAFITNKTQFGRYIYAVGGNKEAAKLSGINITKIKMQIFIIMGVLSAVAGIVFTGRLNSATASAGTNFELDAIAACFIGGASTMGGEGTIIGAMIGALVMATLNNGMSLMNVDITFQYIIKGLILLLAVAVDTATRKKTA